MEEFEKWWKLYPRREHRIAAIKAWKKLQPSPLTIQKMTADLDRYRGVAWEHVPHPASYINGHRWEDERPAASNVIPLKPTGTALQQLKHAQNEAFNLTPEERKANIEKLRAIAASIAVSLNK